MRRNRLARSRPAMRPKWATIWAPMKGLGRDAFEEIDFGREFQDYLDPGYKTQEFEYKEDAPTFERVFDWSGDR